MDNNSAGSSASHSVTLMLVEDDDVDAKAVRRALKEAKVANPVLRVKDGVEALEVLRGQSAHVSLSRPYMLLVDLNMPRMDGIELVKEIRSDPKLSSAVVFILTTSNSELDRALAYRENVAGYIVKESAGRDFLKLISLLESYWFVVEMPTQ